MTRKRHLPPCFDGWPFIWTRVSPGLYHLILLPACKSETWMREIATTQRRLNDLPTILVLGPDRALSLDGEWKGDPIPVPLGGILAHGQLEAFDVIRDTPELAERRERLETICSRQKGFLMGDLTKGSRPATPEELKDLAGRQDSGAPAGLTKCGECGEWRGECLDPGDTFSGRVVTASCRCDNRNLCARCRRPLDLRKLNSNFFKVSDGHIWHSPGFAALAHSCPDSHKEKRHA